MEKLGILPCMRRILNENIETAYPKERVGILADKETVEYVNSATNEDDGGKKGFACTVKVGDIDIATVSACGSKEEAEVRAACDAIKVLEAKVAAGTGGRKRKLDLAVRDDSVVGDDMNSQS